MGIRLIHLISFVTICAQNYLIDFAFEKWHFNSFSCESTIKIPKPIMLWFFSYLSFLNFYYLHKNGKLPILLLQITFVKILCAAKFQPEANVHIQVTNRNEEYFESFPLLFSLISQYKFYVKTVLLFTFKDIEIKVFFFLLLHLERVWPSLYLYAFQWKPEEKNKDK